MIEFPICPYCREQIGKEQETVQCVRCDALHHAACWNEYGNCSVFGCRGQPRSRTRNRIAYAAPILVTAAMLNNYAGILLSSLLLIAIPISIFFIYSFLRTYSSRNMQPSTFAFLLNVLALVMVLWRIILR